MLVTWGREQPPDFAAHVAQGDGVAQIPVHAGNVADSLAVAATSPQAVLR